MAKSHEAFIAQVAQINPNIEILGIYTKAQERVKVRCKNCGHTWSPLAYSLTQGRGCPHCSAKTGSTKHNGKTALKTHSQFISEITSIHPNISVIGQYVNGHTDIECFCNICSHSWSTKPYSLLQNHGCPRCAKSGTSFMEQYIRLSFVKALGEDKVLSRDKSAIGMELDIYIPSLSLAIEPGNWFLHSKSLKRDCIKRDKCAEKGIRLITIYDQFPKYKLPPFSNDCYVFTEDLNKTDRTTIKSLVISLFNLYQLDYTILESLWDELELKAYSYAKAKNHTDFVKELNAIHPDMEVLGIYKNANIRLQVKCKTCGHEWDALPASLLSGDGCRKCGTKTAHKKFIKDQSIFVQEVFDINPDVEIIGNYTGRHNRILARCRICGYEWEPRASSLLRGSNHKGWKTLHK